MNSAALKTVSSQNPSVPNPINKSMHPQSTPTYSQPSGHMPQNPYPNMNVAHNHPNAQQNHFSLNVPSAPSHYIPASNHPVANMSQSATGLQSYTPPKTVSYSAGYPAGHGHSPNHNTASSVSPVLPTTQQPPVQQQTSPQNLSHSSSASSIAAEEETEKPQSNGTPEEKTKLSESEVHDNHVPSESPEEKSQPQHTVSQQIPEKPKESPVEKPSSTPPVQESKPSPEPTKVPEEIITPPVQSTPQPPAVVETDPLAIDTSESVPSPSKPELPEETSEAPAENPVSEECTESASVEATEPQESSSEGISTTDVDKDAQEDNEIDTEKRIDESVESNADMVIDKKESSENESSLQAIPEAKPVAAQRETKKPIIPKPKDSAKPVKVESKPTVPKTPTSSKAVEKRQRIRTQPYQSPLPEIEIITKISSTTPRTKSGDDRLIYFYKNEFLAVRNAEGSFYLCQAIQNIYKSSSKIRIRWLSQDKNDKTGEIYTPDFYDLTDFDCILTSLDLVKVDKGKYRLTQAEKERTDSILKRSLAVEKGEIVSPSVSQEHPDGLDLSLYKDEKQLKKTKKPVKRKLPSQSSAPKKATPTKKTPQAPKVRKVETKLPKKATPPIKPKKSITTTAATTQKKPAPEPKKPAASTSRAARGKRKSDTKTSPVVDPKKAKVLAKIGRKTAIPASTSRSHSTAGKSGKPTKPVPSVAKAVAPANAKSSAMSRKNKRSTRK